MIRGIDEYYSNGLISRAAGLNCGPFVPRVVQIMGLFRSICVNLVATNRGGQRHAEGARLLYQEIIEDMC